MTDGTGDGQVQGPDELKEWFDATLGPGADLNDCSSCPEHQGFLLQREQLCFRVEAGVVHADNEPAIHLHHPVADGEAWVQHGKLHREGGPAVVRPPRPNPKPNVPGGKYEARVVEEWWINGNAYPPDGPAVVYDDGRCDWHNAKGQRHREGDKPAVEYPRPYGAYEHGPDRYYKNGVVHRKLGPAVLGFPARPARYVYTDPEPDQYFFYGVDLETTSKRPAREIWLRMKDHVSAEADYQDSELFIHPKNSAAWEHALENGDQKYKWELSEALSVSLV